MTFPPLTRALRLDTFDGTPIVAFAGGGGKTTAMFTLADDLAAQGRRVVTTTTTRLFASQRDQSPAWCAADNLDALGLRLDEYGQCLVTAPEADWDGQKAYGIAPALVAKLAARPDVDAVLLEADGSRMRPFKAPAPHEPVIPPETTHVVYLVGADIFGKPLDASRVHRPERVMELGGVAEGTPITPDLVARVLTHDRGGLQHVPDGAAFIPFLNKVENEADAFQADETARLLLEHARVREVLLGSLHGLKPEEAGGGEAASSSSLILHPSSLITRRSRTAAIILAAGMARRFGETKQLLGWRGRALVEHVAEVALEVCDTVLVVVGHEAESVARAVEHLPTEVIYNEQFATGQGSSVAAGVAALMETSRPFMGAAFFMVADQPHVSADLLRALQARRGTQLIAVPRFAGQRGSPTLWDAALFPALRALTGDEGGRSLSESYHDEIAWLDVEDEGLLRDVDTRQDWQRLSGRN